MNTKTLITVFVFSITMALLESAVVVYLRALYYPDGFTVALKIIEQRILLVEIAREASTIVMLIAIGLLAGKTVKHQFAYFLISFAAWDVFYYVWLKAYINWPTSLLDWDILFLIPFTWLGPVLAPLLCSVTMFGLGIALLTKKSSVTLSTGILLATGTVFILYTFMVDYGTIIIHHGFYADLANLLHNKMFLEITGNYIPVSYNWLLFAFGESLLLAAIAKLSITPHTLSTVF